MNYSTKVKQKLLSIIEEMGSCRWLFTKNPETDFSRKKMTIRGDHKVYAY